VSRVTLTKNELLTSYTNKMPFRDNDSIEWMIPVDGGEPDYGDGDYLSQWDDLTKAFDSEDYFEDRNEALELTASNPHPEKLNLPLPLHQPPAGAQQSYASAPTTLTNGDPTMTLGGFVSAYVIIDPRNAATVFLPKQLLKYSPPGTEQSLSAVWGPVVLPSSLLSAPQQPSVMPLSQQQQQQPSDGFPQFTASASMPATASVAFHTDSSINNIASSMGGQTIPRQDARFSYAHAADDSSGGHSDFLTSTVEPLQETMHLPPTQPQDASSIFNHGSNNMGTLTALSFGAFPAAAAAIANAPVARNKRARQTTTSPETVKKPKNKGNHGDLQPPQPLSSRLLKPLTAYNYFFRDERDRIVEGTTTATRDNNNDDAVRLPSPVRDFSDSKQEKLLKQHWYVDPNKKKRLHRKTHGKVEFTK
jgi:hypothetical protein